MSRTTEQQVLMARTLRVKRSLPPAAEMGWAGPLMIVQAFQLEFREFNWRSPAMPDAMRKALEKNGDP